MIRNYSDKKDRARITSLLEKMDIEEALGDLDKVVKNSSQFLIYEQDGIYGFSYASVYNNEEESIAQFSVYVEPTYRLNGIGSALYKKMEELIFSEANPDFLCAYMRVELGNPVGFAKKMGFEKWWGSPELIYRGGAFPETNIEFVKYEDKYFNQFVKVVQDSYYELHLKNDIKPYLASEDSVKEYKLNNKDNVYLVLENEQIIASVTIGEGEIDNLMVSPSYQGKGYGRKALQFGMNKILDQGYEEIRICFVEGNDSAERLYSSLGFQPLHNTQVYRKFL